jgi:hypothetical protein
VPATRAVTTVYHAAPTAPLTEPILLVDTEGEVLNTSVLTQVMPGYSGDGRALVSTSVLGAGGADPEPAVRARLATLYQADTAGWEHLATRRVPDALPAMPPPHPLTRPGRLTARRYVAGDYRTTGSVQGALASGARAAREILAAM